MNNPMLRAAWGALALSVLSAATLDPSASAFAADDPPKFFAVTNVPADDVLNMRDVPHGDSKKLASIPPGAHGLKNLGCLKPEPSLERWMTMTDEEKQNAKLEWCRVDYRGTQGWVASRFLKPDPGHR